MTTETTNPVGSVAVLGLGRMGAAMARRLVENGWRVTAWSRSGRTVEGASTAPEAGDAVAGADLVLLSLFDGAACRAVLARCADQLPAGALVVNTSTIAPDEADALADEVAARGAHYVHAPVMGSVPAVAGGTLTVLVGGAAEHTARARTLLAVLGDPVDVGAAADAAATKLLANGVLGGALLCIRDSLRHAADLGVDPSRAASVLERTALGGLVRAKRTRLLEHRFADAEFTVAALAKDLELLASLSPAAKPMAEEVTAAVGSGRIPADGDIAALCVDTGGAAASAEIGTAGLTVAPGVDVPPEVLAPLVAYATGHATGDPSHFHRAFLPTAHVEGLREGGFVSWSLEEYYALFPGRPAADEPTRRRRIDHVAVDGTVGTARMTLRHGQDVFTDVFLLVQVDGGWRIANKVYHRRG